MRSRGDGIVLSEEFVDHGHMAKAGRALSVYLYLRRYVWRSSEGPLGKYWDRGLLAAAVLQNNAAKELGFSRVTVIHYLERLRKLDWVEAIELGEGNQSGLVYILGDRVRRQGLQYEGERYFADPWLCSIDVHS